MSNRSISLLGSGWLGLALARRLKSESYSVSVSTTSPGRLAELKAEGLPPFLIDIGNSSAQMQDFLHAAILICNIPSKDIQGFTRLVAALEQSRVKNVVFVSSTSVYAHDAGQVSESDGLELEASPLVQIERLFLNSESFSTTIVRFGGLVGYSRHPGRFFRNGRAVSDALAKVNLIHRDDCINIISEIIQQGAWGEMFNCCADTHPSKGDFYGRAIQMLGAKPEFGDSADNSYKIVRNDKVKRVLDYQFVHPDLMQIDFNEEDA
jgi:nucleoside-diphosphate-sugar epimerase